MNKIVCLGDSITCNWGEETFTDYWQEMIDDKKYSYQVINAGVNGEIAQDGYYRLDRDVIAHSPEIVTIMFGHNEIGRGLSVAHWEQYMHLIIGKLDALLNGVNIWVLTPNKIGEVSRTHLYKPLLESLQFRDSRYKVIDIWNSYPENQLDSIYTYTFQDKGKEVQDYIHPNEIGQQIIATILMKELENYATR